MTANAPGSIEPHTIDLPKFPDGYIPAGGTDGLLTWEQVAGTLASELHYWMSTARSDGRVHVVPRWGVWHAGRFFYDGSPETVHVQNLRKNRNCTIAAGTGARATLAEGESHPSEPLDADQAEPIRQKFASKYGELGYTPEPGSWSGPDAGGLRVFTPTKILAWTDFSADPTRFTFPSK